MSRWEKATRGDGREVTCPECFTQTEYKMGSLVDAGGKMVAELLAERCPACGWVIEFTDDGPVRVR